MPAPEQTGVPRPENQNKAEEHTVYLRAAHFSDGLASQQAYIDIQRTIRTAQASGEVAYLTEYHLTSQEDVRWYVAVVGRKPPDGLATKLASALSAGVQTALPEEFEELVTRYHTDTPASTMTVEEWLTAAEQGEHV